MEILNIVRDNWFELLQSFAIVSGYLLAQFSYREEARQRRVSNRLEILKQHRDIWTLRFAYPELSRVSDHDADLDAKPMTGEEKLFVHMLILHLAGCFRAAQSEMFTLPDEIRADIANFFSKPVPRAVWEQSMRFQNSDFVRFIEKHRVR